MVEVKMTLAGNKPSSFSVKDILDLPDAKCGSQDSQPESVAAVTAGAFKFAIYSFA